DGRSKGPRTAVRLRTLGEGRAKTAESVIGRGRSLDRPTLTRRSLRRDVFPLTTKPQLVGGQTSLCFDNGSSRILFPVAAYTALSSAGTTGGRPGSPTPPGSASLSTRCTST